MNIEMEQRFCKSCGRSFKVMITSKQILCSNQCDKFSLNMEKTIRNALSGEPLKIDQRQINTWSFSRKRKK